MVDMSNMDMSDPLPLPRFHILLALLQGASHGYGLLQSVREQSGGRVPLGTGSLYRHLSRLIDAGLVAETRAETGADPRRGTYYRLTPRGRQVLAEERDRLAGLVRALDGLGGVPRKRQA
jgi:DNA-binding PadR family transcriptional regulator